MKISQEYAILIKKISIRQRDMVPVITIVLLLCIRFMAK